MQIIDVSVGKNTNIDCASDADHSGLVLNEKCKTDDPAVLEDIQNRCEGLTECDLNVDHYLSHINSLLSVCFEIQNFLKVVYSCQGMVVLFSKTYS